MAKKKYENFTSECGVAVFPHLTKADTKFKEEGEYHVKLRLQRGAPGVDEFLEQINAKFEENYVDQCKRAREDNKKKPKKCTDLPFADVENDEGEETSEVDVKFKLPALIKGKPTKVKFFDAKGKVIENPQPIYGGSELKINFYYWGWNFSKTGAGVTLRLRGVQIIKLVTATGASNNPDDYGFGEEDGYEAPEADDTPFKVEDNEEDTGDDDEF